MDFTHIRNFAIIAHIDHGKSTLADRLIEECGGLDQREMEDQVLDSMPLEKERGITIKAQTVRLSYCSKKDNKLYQLNLMDTPGHVDFAYEVNRSLAACEGSILVVDATQGVEAQTLANVYQAINNDHTIIIALNKIDLPAADPEKVKTQIEEIIGLDTQSAILTSAKSGIGISELLEGIVHLLPPPRGKLESEFKAMLIDSWYDPYLGIGVLIRIVDGHLRKGMRIRFVATNVVYTVEQLGYFTPKRIICEELHAGEIGFFTAAIKDTTHCKIGDTITTADNTQVEPLPGFKPNLPVVFCGLYPSDPSKYIQLKTALAKLHLNDSSFQYEAETSLALGVGFRCGFLGLLHLEIIQERLEREFDLDIVTTAPSVIYKIHLRDKQVIEVHNPADLPDLQKITYMEEPWIKATIMVPTEYLSAILNLCANKRGVQLENNYVANQHLLVYRLPLNEVIFDFYDKLKSYTRGYASFDWTLDSYETSDLVKLAILVNSEQADAFTLILHQSQAQSRGREICEALKDLIQPQLFNIAIQAAVGSRIIARETIKAKRKDVLAKCYGGDITRKRKLLEKQQEGKKRMRSIGKVEVPSDVFRKVFSTTKDKS